MLSNRNISFLTNLIQVPICEEEKNSQLKCWENTYFWSILVLIQSNVFSQLIVIAITSIAITIIAISIIVKSPGKAIVEILLCPLQGATIPVVNCPLIAILPFLGSFLIIVKTVIQEKMRKRTWQEYNENIYIYIYKRIKRWTWRESDKHEKKQTSICKHCWYKKVQREDGEWCPMRAREFVTEMRILGLLRILPIEK